MNFRFTLSHSSGPDEVLTSQPKGWDQIEFIARRDEKYIGMFFDFTIKLDFLCNGGGKEFIDDIYDNYGVDAEITILIEQDCDESGTYEEVYIGTLDLETYERTYTQPEFTTVGIVQAGPLQTIKKRLETNIDLTKLETIDGTALTDFPYGPYDLNLHSKVIKFTSELSSTFNSIDSGSIGSGDIFQKRTAIMIVLPFNLTELPTIDSYIEFLKAQDNFDSSFPDTLYTAFESGTYTIDYKLLGSITIVYQDDCEYRLRVSYRVNDVSDPYTIYDAGLHTYAGGTATVFNLDFEDTLTLTLNAGDTFSFFAWFEGFDNFGHVDRPISIAETLDKSSYIKISKDTTTPDSTCKAFAIHEAFARVSQSITNSTDAFRSNFFGRINSAPNSYSSNGCGSFTAITNGFQIRQFPLADRPPFISMKALFDSCNAIYNLGLGIEQSGGNYYIRVEPKEYFFSTDVLFQIPNIKGLKVSIAKDLYFNNFTCGYNNWQQDGTQGVNGLDEVNTKRSYTIGLKKTGETLEALSDLVAGPYPLERTRRKPYINFATTNFQYDDKNFIICLNRSVDGSGVPDNLITAEKDENFPGTQNILSPETTYNERITPGRILRNWLNWLTPSIIKSNDVLKNIKFASGEGNYTMTSQGTDDCDSMDYIDESANIEVIVPNSNPRYNPLFVPEVVEFTAPLSLAQYKLIKANPTRCIEISTNEVSFDRAFILNIKYKPTRGQASFTMLLS